MRYTENGLSNCNHFRTQSKLNSDSVVNHAAIVFVTCVLDLSPFDVQINGFPGLSHRGKFVCQTFGESSCIGIYGTLIGTPMCSVEWCYFQ